MGNDRTVRLASKMSITIALTLLGLGSPQSVLAQGVCYDAVQGKIAWNYSGSTSWAPANIDRLCSGAEDSSEPAECFRRVMHTGIDWGGGTRWQWSNATDLCKGTRDADRTIRCFRSEIGRSKTWNQALAACGDYAKLVPPTPEPAPADVDPPAAGSGVQLRPADERTLIAAQNAQLPRAITGLRPFAGLRVTNQDGWYDVVVRTTGRPTYGVCSTACFETSGCKAFVISGPKNARGGFCGLITELPSRRYDRAWIDDSPKYSSYLAGGLPAPDALDMVGSRTVALAMVLNSRSQASLPALIEKAPTSAASSTAAKSLEECARRCTGNRQCTQFLSSPGSRQCMTFRRDGPRQPLSEVTDFRRNGAIHGFVETFDRRPADQQKFLRMFDPAVGLGLFSKPSLSVIGKSLYGLADRVEGLSAAMHTATDGIWFGAEPPVAREMRENEPALQVEVVSDVLEGARPGLDYLPFQETVWRSKSEPGTYYFAPKSYWLDWSAEDGRLGGSQFFSAAGTLGDGRDVRMQIRLSGSFTTAEVEVFEKLVRAYVAQAELPRLDRLRLFPVEGSPELDLRAGLAGLAGEVETHSSPSEFGAPIDLVFNVNDLAAQSLVENFVSEDGQAISGTLTFRSAKIDGGSVVVPVTLDPRSSRTYGGGQVTEQAWTNRSPLSARLTGVRMLVIRPDKAEILSWRVQGAIDVAPGQSVRLATSSEYPAALAERADRIWVEYEVDRSCRSCLEAAFGVGAVSSEARSTVEFVLPSSLASQLDAEEIEIAFRSRYLRPDDDRERLAPPVVLTLDEPSAYLQPLYLPEDQQLGSGGNFYSYKARLFTTEGGELCSEWLESGAQRVRLRASMFEGGGERCE